MCPEPAPRVFGAYVIMGGPVNRNVDSGFGAAQLAELTRLIAEKIDYVAALQIFAATATH